MCLKIEKINEMALKCPQKFVEECENKFNSEIKKTVDYIIKNDIKYIFVSGPSSSGKTTFSKKFAHYIGKYKHIDISLDDYYKEFSVMPLKRNGEYNFESVNTLRLDIIRKDFKKLINGEEVSLPLVDFETGKRVEDNEKIRLDNETLVVIEGLHALNKKILSIFKEEKIFKIFICPVPDVTINNSKLSRYDLRFTRRMVRDNNYRNSDAKNSLKMWKTVRDGEKIYMDGYRKNADKVINTFLPYEPCILKKEALPLLESVNNESKYFNKALRLKRIFEKFETIDYNYVPENSLLNEFIKK